VFFGPKKTQDILRASVFGVLIGIILISHGCYLYSSSYLRASGREILNVFYLGSSEILFSCTLLTNATKDEKRRLMWLFMWMTVEPQTIVYDRQPISVPADRQAAKFGDIVMLD
jgi:hypothetical protein